MNKLPLLGIVALLSLCATAQRTQGGPKPGEPAPEFVLKIVGEDKKFTLKDNFGERPTVLIFGSYT